MARYIRSSRKSFQGMTFSRNLARSRKTEYPQERNLTLWKRCHIISLKPRCQECFISSCGLLVTHVILILIFFIVTRALSSLIFRLTLAFCQVPRFHPRGVWNKCAWGTKYATVLLRNPIPTTYAVLRSIYPISRPACFRWVFLRFPPSTIGQILS